MCPHSGFLYRRSDFCTVVPVLGSRNAGLVPSFRLWVSPKPPFWKPLFREPPKQEARVRSSGTKAHNFLTHQLFETPVNPRTTSRLTRRECFFPWVQRSTHKPFLSTYPAGCPGVKRTLTRAKRLCLCAFFS